MRKDYFSIIHNSYLLVDKFFYTIGMREKKQKEVDYRREQLKVRQIERKTVDILREKRFNQFMADEKRKEEIANDEFALFAHMRKVGKEVKEHGFR